MRGTKRKPGMRSLQGIYKESLKSDVKISLYYVFSIILIIVAIVFVSRAVGGTQSIDAESFRLAHSISSNIDALSAVESGKVIIDSEKVFDVEIMKYDSILRSIAIAILPQSLENYVKKNGYYVVVTLRQEYKPDEGTKNIVNIEPKKTERTAKSVAFITSYPESLEKEVSFKGLERVCIVKEADKRVAEVKSKC